MNKLLLVLFCSVFIFQCNGKTYPSKEIAKTQNNFVDDKPKDDSNHSAKIILGIEAINQYLPLLKGKKVAIVANQTSQIHNVHLLDTLLSRQVDVIKIFSPEHGFRGKASAGEKVNSSIDAKTQLPIVSLYGRNKKPKADQLKDVEVLIFDIQDVGARFYTYISTMHYVMEAAAELDIPFIVLDRPNPNGMYVDGPILKSENKSFVGIHPIPILHGLTIGELAKMINGEGWLKNKMKVKLTVIKCDNYNHQKEYDLPITPSPNLPNSKSIQWYPSLCFFEGTNVSVGRGTDLPFQVYGAPYFPDTLFSFTPKSTQGSKYPKHQNKKCFGYNLSESNKELKSIDFQPLIDAYNLSQDKSKFFNNNGFFHLLTGDKTIMKMIKEGKTNAEIKNYYQSELNEYKKMRKKYLIYD